MLSWLCDQLLCIQVLHNIAVAEYFHDGCPDPKKLLDVLDRVKVSYKCLFLFIFSLVLLITFVECPDKVIFSLVLRVSNFDLSADPFQNSSFFVRKINNVV